MLVIFLAIVISTTFIYYIIKIWIENWLHDFRISPPGSSSRRFKRNIKDKIGIDTSTDRMDLTNNLFFYDTSSDESIGYEEKRKNPLSVRKAMRKDTSDKNVIIVDLDHEETKDKCNPSVFDISTDDSNISDDFTQSSSKSYASSMKMFSWGKQDKKDNEDKITESGTTLPNTVSKEPRQKRFKRDKNTKTKNFNFPILPDTDNPTKNETILPEAKTQHEITIAGVKVKLPMKPYPCQIAVMNMLIQGCTREQNCLLESPTGSGKTLALLCGALAWQENYKEQLKKESSKMDVETFPDYNCHGNGACAEPGADCCSMNDPTSFGAFEKPKAPLYVVIDDDDDASDNDKNKSKKPKVPKIYYGTRTHKQLSQVVKELARSSYSHKRMTVLSGREHTCIQNSTRNKTELCQDLLDVEKKLGCPYYNEKNRKDLSRFDQLALYGISGPFDIEDLVELGRERGLCPYFGARNLAETAEIIFCPYNYIIDPDIRESMQINLKGQIVILDEAHNTEDVCREVGSVSIREDDLLGVIMECESLAKKVREDHYTYTTIARYVQDLMKYIKSVGLASMGTNNNLSSPCWSGSELLELFEINGIGSEKCLNLVSASLAAIQDFVKTKEDLRAGYGEKKQKKTISRSTKIVLQHLTFGLNKIVSKDYSDDYRACITESFVKNVKKIRDNTWTSTQNQGERLRTLKLMCMNPAVIFAPLARDARSIILASGTLTPTASFQSELGTKFPHVLSANHVISSDQVYVRCVPKGPTGVVLRANYENVNKWKFQDELGKLIVDVCRSVPHGILCFFSSYHMMNTQIKRWKKSNVWHEIQTHKRLFIEPRYTGDLTQIMMEYRQTIEETSDRNNSYPPSVTGAILFAVFRGKVAEGIDFSDNEARCVMAIGIPYPIKKDPEVNMKFTYNDQNSSKGLLKGSEWYTIQAFRALNQAVGRCIRHKNDWGAVLLVDQRFKNQVNINNLPKWIRIRWKDNSTENLAQELKRFVITKTKQEKDNASKL